MLLSVAVEPKGTQLLDKDAWKERFLLQLKDEAVPVTVFVDDNDYKIWGFHFFNQDTRMGDFDKEMMSLTHKPIIYDLSEYDWPVSKVAEESTQ